MSLQIATGKLYVKFGRKFIETEATVEQFDAMQRELRRLRISQLRRMVGAAVILERSAEEVLRLEQHRRHRGWPHRDCGFLRRRYIRLVRFIVRMDDEIERLRGEG